MNEGGWGPSMALLRIRLGPAISIIQHDERSLGSIARKDGYGLTGSLEGVRVDVQGFILVS